MCIRRGGSNTKEHGVGMENREHLAHMFAPTNMEVMKRLRRSIDPLEIANHPKMFPDENGNGRVPAPVFRSTTGGAGPTLRAGSFRNEHEAVAGHARVRPRGRGHQVGSVSPVRRNRLPGPARIVRHRGVRAGGGHLHGAGGNTGVTGSGDIGPRGTVSALRSSAGGGWGHPWGNGGGRDPRVGPLSRRRHPGLPPGDPFRQRSRAEKAAFLERLQPDAVEAGNVGCLMQIESRLRWRDSAIPVLHSVELRDRV